MKINCPKSIIPDEYLFLWLKIMSYPSTKTNDVFEFCELRDLRLGNFDQKEIFRFLLSINNAYNIKISNVSCSKKHCNIQKIFENKYSTSQIQNFFKKPNNSALGKVLEDINFKIKISKKSQLNMLDSPDTYLDDFLNDNLAMTGRDYFKFEKQKKLVLEKIKIDAKDCGNNLSLSSSDFDPKVKLIDTMLILQKQVFLQIQKISTDDKAKGNFKIDFAINRNEIFSQGKQNRKIPTLRERESGIYLVFYKNDKGIKISATKSSARYKMLSFLVEEFGVNRTVESIYEKIEDCPHIKPTRNSDEMVKKIKNLRRELNRNKKLSKNNLKIKIKNNHRKTVCIDFIK